MRILVVEDSPELAECLAAGLEMHGHTVRVSSTLTGTKAALRAFRPEGVISDGHFPWEPGRRETYSWGVHLLRLCEAAHVPAILYSGDADLVEGMRSAGFVTYMKPTRTEVLVAALEGQRVVVLGMQKEDSP